LLQGGVNFGGQLQSVSGVNTVSGLLTLPFGAVIGADAGSTLRIYGGIQNTTGNNTLMLVANGNIVLGNTEMSRAGTTLFNSVEKLGTGTLRIESSNVTEVIDQGTNGLLIRQGTVLVNDNGSWRSRVYLDVGSTLRLDNTNVNVSAGRMGTTVGGIYKNITFRGGWLDLIGGTLSGLATTEGFADVGFGRGLSMISIMQQSQVGSPTNLVFRGAAWGNQAPAQTTAAPGVSMVFRGVGQGPGPGRASVQFTGGAPARSGEDGGASARNRGILPWAIVDFNYSGAFGSNVSFAALGAVNNNIRWLESSEYEIDPTVFGGTAQGVVTNSNLLLTAASSAATAVALNTQRNSLTIEGGAGLSLSDGVQFSLRSGGILVRPGSVSTITGGVINQVAASTSPLNVWTIGDLTISSALAGGNGLTNPNISFVKAGEGTLTIAPPISAINGLAAAGQGVNSMGGQFVLNQGTVKLGSLNAIQANNYFAPIGGTLDLNGNSQLTFGTFTDSVVTNQGSNITTSTGAGHLLINNDNSGRQLAARLTGNVSLTRSGLNTLNLWSVNTHTGTTTINGGSTVMYGDAAFTATTALNINSALLYLENDNSNSANSNRINDAAVVNLRGGLLELRGRQQTALTENLGTVNLVAGGSQFIVAAGTLEGVNAVISIADLNRSTGSVANFTTGLTNRVTLGAINGVPTTDPTTLTNGILGGWAVIGTLAAGTHHFASYSPTLGVGAMGTPGFQAYSNATTDATTLVGASATSNISLDSATTFTHPVANDLTLNSLRFANQATQTIDIAAGKTLTLGTGGLMAWSTQSHYVGLTDSVGNVTSGGNELFLYAQGAGWHVMRSNIVNPTGIDMAVTKSGSNTWSFNGTNTYSGGTTIANGQIVLWSSAGPLPLATDPTKGLVVNGSWQNAGQFLAYRAGSIALGNEVTINGNGSVLLFGDNTLSKLTFNNDGSNGTGYLRTFANYQANGDGSTGVLTIGSGGLVATSSNVTTTPFIEGRVDFGASPNVIDVAPISGGGFTDVDPLRPTFALQAIVGSLGGITKTGNGVLDFRAQNVFTSEFVVSAGGIRTGVLNSGSRFSTLNLGAGTRFDLNNLATTWGGLTGSGDIFSSQGTPTLNVGFNNANTTFAGRFMRFNDASFGQLNKIGTGRLTLTSAQPTTGSFGAISVSGGTLAYSGAGRAFVSTASALSTFNVNTGGTLLLDNSNGNVNHRLGALLGGTVNIQGGLLSLGGVSSGATTEGVATLAVLNGGGRLELTPDAFQGLNFTIGTLAAASPTGTLVIAGVDKFAGTGLASVAIANPTFAAGQGMGFGNRVVRGDILVDGSVSGAGEGFLTVDSMTGNIRPLDLVTETTILQDTLGGSINASLAGTLTLSAPTTVNTLTSSGTASVGSRLAASVFGKYGPSGDLLSLSLANAAGFLVKDGTTTFNLGTLVGPTAGAAYFHVLTGATLNVDAALIPAATGGFVLSGGGTMELGATTGFFTGSVAINNGTLKLDSGADNTLAISATAGAMGLAQLSLNSPTAVLDIGAFNQTVRALSSSNTLPGMGGTVTGLAGAVFTTTDNSTFGGKLTGGLSFARSGNTTTTFTSASDYTGTTVVRGGTLELRDGGAIASTAGLRLAQGILNLNNYGLNAVANPVRLNPANEVTMSGGTLTFVGGGSVDNTLALNRLNLERGSNQINTNPYISMGATNRIDIGNIVVASAGVRPVMNFNGWTTLNNGGINTLGGQGLTQNSNIWLTQVNGAPFSAANLVNGIIGGWAVADGSTFATYSPTFGVVAMGQQYSVGGSYPAPNFAGGDINAATVASGNYNDGAAARAITGARVANSWRLSLNANQDFTFTNAPITLGVGIITNNGSTITLQGDSAVSSLTSSGPDLYVYTNQGTLNINMTLTGAMNFVKTGGGTLTLRTPTVQSSNTYVGTTFVNGGALNLSAAAGNVMIPGDLVITGLASGTNSSVTMQGAADQIASGANVSLLGGANLTMFGINTLRAVTFDNEGAMVNPTLNAATNLILSDAAPLTATNQSPVTVPTVTGTSLQFSSANPVITVNAGLAATGLTISAPITQNGGMATLTKAGSGVLALGGQSTFTTDFFLNAGGLMFAANSTLVTGTMTSSPVGLGTLQLASGVSLLSDGTVRTIANPVAVNGDFAFGGRGAGAGVTLTGRVNLGAAARTISVTNYGVTASFNGGLATDVADRSTAFTKTGNGILTLGTASTSADLKGAGVTVSGGIVRWAIENSLPADTFLTAGVASGFDLAGFNQTTHRILGTGFFTNSSTTTPSILTVGGDDSSFTFSGALTDNVAGGGAALNLTKVGTGALSFGAVNNYAGLTDIQAGRLDITNIGSFGLGPVNIASGAELRMDRTGTLNFPNELSGSGDVRSIGAGTTILTAFNSSFTGRFLVDNGVLQVGDGTLAGDDGELGSAQQVIVTLPGQLRFNYTVDYALLRVIRGTGDVVQESTKVLSMGGSYGANPFVGRVVVNNGTIEVNAQGILAAATGIVVNRGNYFDQDANQVQTGSFFKVTGSDTVGTPSYGVPLTLNGGTADVQTQTAYLGLVTLNGGDLTSDTVTQLDQVTPYTPSPSWVLLGNVVATDNSTISAEFVDFGAASASRDFNVSNGKTLTFSGSFGDRGAFVASYSKSGAGTLELTGSAKTNSGTVTLNGGFLKFAAEAQLGTSSAATHGNLVFAGGSVEYTGPGTLTRNFLVKDGGAGFHSNRLVDPFVINAADQIDFDDAAPLSGRALTLSGTSTLANTYNGDLLDNTDAARAFSAIVKNGVGQWIVDGAGASLAPDAEVNVNGGVLGFYMNALGATASNGGINLANNTTLRWESTNNQDLGARLKVADGATATIQVANNTTFSGGLDFAAGANTGTGALVKTGAGNLTLAGAAGTFSGGLTVAQGTVTVNNSTALGSGTATIGSGSTLVVNNAVTNNIVVAAAGMAPSGGQLVASAAVGNVTVGSGATIGRGATIGSFTTTGMTLAGGARLEFKLWDINTQSAGVGYDQYAFGNLDLSGASVNNKITIKLISMSTASTLGAAGNLSLLQGAAGIQTFSFGSFNAGGLNLGGNNSANISDLFTFDTSQFTYTGGTASAASLWAIDFNTNSGAITLTAVPEPSTYGLGLGALALAAAAIRRRRQTKKA
jgi:autotransporter-associated beta strand protein